MAENIKNTTLNGAFWSFIERFSVQGVQFIITIVMARLLLPSDYGLIGMLAIFIGISQIFIDGGFSNALIQCKNKEEEDFSTVFFINISISIIIYLILFVSAPYIASFYSQPILCSITRIYSLNLIINSLGAVNKTKLTIAIDFKTQSKISLLSAVISGVVGIICALNGIGVWALVVQALLSSVLNVFFSFFYVKWFPSLVFSKKSFRKLFSFGSKLLVAQCISSIYTNLYSAVIGKKFSSSDLGYYTRACQFVQLLSTNISGILSRVSFPVLSKIDDDNALKSIYTKYLKLSCFIMFPLILGLCGIAKPLIILLLTDNWINSIPLLRILCFAYLFDGVISINLNLLYVKGRSDLVLRLEVIKKTIAFIIMIVSFFFDLTIVCLGSVLYSLIALYLNTIYTKKILDEGFFKQVKTFLPYLLLSLLIMVEALVISDIVSIYWLAILLSLIICFITYVGLSKLFSLYAYNEVINIIKEKLKQR